VHLHIILVKLSNCCIQRLHWVFGFQTEQITNQIWYGLPCRNMFTRQASTMLMNWNSSWFTAILTRILSVSYWPMVWRPWAWVCAKGDHSEHTMWTQVTHSDSIWLLLCEWLNQILRILLYKCIWNTVISSALFSLVVQQCS